MPKSLWGAIGPGALLDYALAFGRGHGSGLPQGDLSQQGGVLFIADGEVRYRRVNSRIGDITPATDILDAVLKWAATGATS